MMNLHSHTVFDVDMKLCVCLPCVVTVTRATSLQCISNGTKCTPYIYILLRIAFRDATTRSVGKSLYVINRTNLRDCFILYKQYTYVCVPRDVCMSRLSFLNERVYIFLIPRRVTVQFSGQVRLSQIHALSKLVTLCVLFAFFYRNVLSNTRRVQLIIGSVVQSSAERLFFLLMRAENRYFFAMKEQQRMERENKRPGEASNGNRKMNNLSIYLLFISYEINRSA